MGIQCWVVLVVCKLGIPEDEVMFGIMMDICKGDLNPVLVKAGVAVLASTAV